MNYVEPFLTLFYNVVDRIGVKVAFAGAIEYAVFCLLTDGKITEQYAIPAMVIIAVAFFVSRVKESQAKAEANGGTTPTTPPTL